MNPEAFVFVPNAGQQQINNDNNNNVNTLSAEFSNKLTIDTTTNSAYNHEAIIQDAVCFNFFCSIFYSIFSRKHRNFRN